MLIPFEIGLYFHKWVPIVGERLYVPCYGSHSRMLKSYVYHELGHAIHDHFDLAGWLDPFYRKWVNYREYRRRTELANDWDRQTGFASA